MRIRSVSYAAMTYAGLFPALPPGALSPKATERILQALPQRLSPIAAHTYHSPGKIYRRRFRSRLGERGKMCYTVSDFDHGVKRSMA